MTSTPSESGPSKRRERRISEPPGAEHFRLVADLVACLEGVGHLDRVREGQNGIGPAVLGAQHLRREITVADLHLVD